jgi:hypothetical protein
VDSLVDEAWQVRQEILQSAPTERNFTTLAAALQREYGARINYVQGANQFPAGRVALEQTIGMPLSE